MDRCTLCQIAAKELPSVVVWENEGFVCVENKNPKAPIHVLVFPKKHIEKKQVSAGAVPGFLSGMMDAVYAAVRRLKLDATGYKLVNHGAGYNHFEHEHWHVLGGLTSKQE